MLQPMSWREAIVIATEGVHVELAGTLIGLVVSSATNLALPSIVGKAVDTSASIRSKDIFGAVIFFFVGATGSLLRVYSLSMAQAKIANRIRSDVFRKIMLREVSSFESMDDKTAMSISLLNDANEMAGAICKTGTSLYRGLNSSLGGSFMLFSISPQLTLVSLGLIPFFGSCSMVFGKNSKTKSKRLQERFRQAISRGCDRLNHLSTVRLFCSETLEINSFDLAQNKLESEAKGVALLEGLFMAGLNISLNVSLLSVIIYGGRLVAKHELTGGQLTSFGLYSGMVGLGFSQLSATYADFSKALGSSYRLRQFMGETPVFQPEDDIQKKMDTADLLVKNVGFSYNSENRVLENVSFLLHPGKVYALTGRSGAGKSTLFLLLSRLRKPQTGWIELNGIDIEDIPMKEYLRSITLIGQQPILFSDLSVFENIRYGSEDVTETQVQQACIRASIKDFIDSLPNGIHTILDSNHASFSAGESQRIALARAFVRQTPLVLLDEVTSALDGNTATWVQQSLKQLANDGCTVLVIAHRESTLEMCDQILVLEEGHVTGFKTV